MPHLGLTNQEGTGPFDPHVIGPETGWVGVNVIFNADPPAAEKRQVLSGLVKLHQSRRNRSVVG